MRKIFIFLLLILFVNISFLFSGPPENKGPEAYCPHRYIRLNELMGVPVNCDEFTFIGVAAHPAYLLQQNSQRQARPVYILFGTALGYTIYYTLYPFHKRISSFIQQKLSGQFSSPEIQKGVLYGSIYSSFIILNFIILILSMLLFEKVILMLSGNWKNNRWLLWMCLVMLISNQVSKVFFWTAHQQMFTIFTPIACVYAGLTIYASKYARKEIFLFSFVSGMLLLVYGNFLLVLPVLLFSYILKLKSQKISFTTSSLFTILAAITLFSLPTIIWIAYLKFTGVTYYNHEVAAHRQLVWITDSLGKSFSHFLYSLYINTVEFLKSSGSLFFTMMFSIAVVISKRVQRKNTELNKYAILSYGNKIIMVSFFLFTIFLWLLGSYADRLTFSLAPFLLIATVSYLNKEKISPNIQLTLSLLILLIHFYTVFFNAPHFSEDLFFL